MILIQTQKTTKHEWAQGPCHSPGWDVRGPHWLTFNSIHTHAAGEAWEPMDGGPGWMEEVH